MTKRRLSSCGDQIEAEARLFEISVLVSCYGDEQQKQLWRLVKKLHTNERGTSYGRLREAAKKLGIRDGTFRKRLHCFRRWLAEKMTEDPA